jgi:hypothetical protein
MWRYNFKEKDASLVDLVRFTVISILLQALEDIL